MNEVLREAGKILVDFKEHSDWISSVAWSPDGSKVVSGGLDETVKVWDAETGNVLVNFREHGHNVNSVDWSPDGTKIASGSRDETAKVWDAETGNVLVNFTEHSLSVRSIGWSPDGTKIASGSEDQTVKIWDAETGDVLVDFTEHSGWVYSVAWSPDGTKIASGSRDETAKVWDAETGNVLVDFTEHGNGVITVAWSPDGSKVVSGSFDNTAKVWGAETGDVLVDFTEHSDNVESVAWSPDGSKIASGSADHTVKIWDDETGDILFDFTEHSDRVHSVAWSPDGSKVVSGSRNEAVKVWYDQTIYLENKVLILSNNEVYTIEEKSFVDLEISSPIEEHFLNYGVEVSYLKEISESEWSQLENPTILYYTENKNRDIAYFGVEKDQFDLIDEVGTGAKLKVYTNEEEAETTAFVYETEGYTIAEYFGEEDVELVTYSDNPDGAYQAEIEYEPFRIEDHDEIDILTWSDTDRAPEYALHGVPVNQMLIANQDITFNDIQDIHIEGSPEIKMVFSFDGGTTWTGKDPVDVNNQDQVDEHGFTLQEVNSWTTEELQAFIQGDQFRPAFYFNQQTAEEEREIIAFSVNEIAYTESPVITSGEIVYDMIEGESASYYVSRDDGVTWKEVNINQASDLSDLPEGQEIRIKAVLQEGQEIHAISFSWI